MVTWESKPPTACVCAVDARDNGPLIVLDYVPNAGTWCANARVVS